MSRYGQFWEVEGGGHDKARVVMEAAQARRAGTEQSSLHLPEILLGSSAKEPDQFKAAGKMQTSAEHLQDKAQVVMEAAQARRAGTEESSFHEDAMKLHLPEILRVSSAKEPDPINTAGKVQVSSAYLQPQHDDDCMQPLPSPRALFAAVPGFKMSTRVQKSDDFQSLAQSSQKQNAGGTYKTHAVETLDREIRLVDEKLKLLQNEAQGNRGKKLLLTTGQRAKIGMLKRDRQAFVVERNRHVLRLLTTEFARCVSSFMEGVLHSLADFANMDEVRTELHKQPGYLETWKELSTLPKDGVKSKEEIEEFKAYLQSHELEALAGLEKDFFFALQKHELPATPALPDEGNENETEIDLQEMQQNIETLKQFIPGYGKGAAISDLTSSIPHKAAQYLKTKVTKMAAEVEYKAMTDENDVVDPNMSSDDMIHGHHSNVIEEEKMPIKRGWLEFEENDERGRNEFVGELQGGYEHGLGTMLFIDGTQYRGNFCSGHSDGFGHEIYADGSSYKGQFRENMRHGLGVYLSSLGEKYYGEWAHGERHGHGAVSQIAQGNTETLLVSFENGDFVNILQDKSLEDDLQDRMDAVLRQAIETAQMAQGLATEIRNQGKKGVQKGNFKEISNAVHGPAVQYEGALFEGAKIESVEKLAAPHQDLRTWLDAIGLIFATDPIRSQGFEKPADLLHFLLDVDAYDSFVDVLGLKASQGRVLWKALENLDVVLTPRDDALGPGLSAPEHEAARQAAVEAGAKESNKMHVKQQKVGKGEEEARHLIKQQDQVEIRRLLMMTAKEEERERRQVEKNIRRVMHITKAVDDEEKRIRKLQRQKIRMAIARMKKAVLTRVFSRWRDIAQEIADARYAEEERLRIEREAEEARVRAVLLEQERVKAEKRRIAEEAERRRREAEEARRQAEEARLRAIELQRQQAATKLQASLARIRPQRRFQSIRKHVKTLQAHLQRRTSCHAPEVLNAARREYHARREKEVEWEEIVGFDAAITEDMLKRNLNRVEIQSPTVMTRIKIADVVAELREINRIEVLRAQIRQAMTVAHKLEMVRRERIRRKLKDEEDRRQRLLEEMERLRKEEEERERERKWKAAEAKALKESEMKEREVQKAAEIAARWSEWAAEEERQREIARTLQRKLESERLLAKERDQKIQQARVLEMKRRENLMAASKRVKDGCRTKVLDPLRARMSRQAWAQGGGGSVRPPVGLIPWDTRFHLNMQHKQQASGSTSSMDMVRRVKLCDRRPNGWPRGRSRSEMKGRYNFHSREGTELLDSNSNALQSSKPFCEQRSQRGDQYSNTNWKQANDKSRFKEVVLPKGALSVSAWEKMHPAASVRPRTSMRRLMLIQEELRKQGKKRLEKQQKRQDMEAARLRMHDEQVRDSSLKAQQRKALIADVMKEFEETLAAIVEFERAQDERRSVREQAGTHVGHWLKPFSAKKPSLSDSILNRRGRENA